MKPIVIVIAFHVIIGISFLIYGVINTDKKQDIHQLDQYAKKLHNKDSIHNLRIRATAMQYYRLGWETGRIRSQASQMTSLYYDKKTNRIRIWDDASKKWFTPAGCDSLAYFRLYDSTSISTVLKIIYE